MTLRSPWIGEDRRTGQRPSGRRRGSERAEGSARSESAAPAGGRPRSAGHVSAPRVRVAVLIPVLDEELALPGVLAHMPPGVRVVVCDNGSRDTSAAIARAAGAEVVTWSPRGYGGAVLAGIRHLASDPPDVIVVWDGDQSVDPADLPTLLAPIERGEADLVLGDRTRLAERGALPPQQRWGNQWASMLLRLSTGHASRDMGPFRAIRYDALVSLAMGDPTWGWNVEMHLKALGAGLRVVEVPVHCRVRVGQSKISGTVRGTVRAGARITWAFWRYRT
ncbi:MAG: glycosyltransferase family 2 protein [Myxococcales bacterium]|nr:glycosyltransferase family 2 protein [Myxococcales bacterium]